MTNSMPAGELRHERSPFSMNVCGYRVGAGWRRGPPLRPRKPPLGFASGSYLCPGGGLMSFAITCSCICSKVWKKFGKSSGICTYRKGARI